MTGSAFTRWELHCRVISLDKGRGLGRGWWPIAMCPEAGGFFYWALGGLFFVFFSKLFFTSFFKGFFLDFGGVLEAKMGAKTSFWNVFCDVFVKGILESIFRLFF